MARLKLDPIRARNLSNDYAKWLLQEQRERTPATGKLFARLHTTGGRRFHGFTEVDVCKISRRGLLRRVSLAAQGG